MSGREPVGFIVEGHGEYNCYPSLFCRTVGASGILIPRVNAGGCGSVVKRLKEQLTDLLLAYSPLTVIVTVDLEDVLDQNLADSCSELLKNLDNDIHEWFESAKEDTRLDLLPERVVCIVQIKMFETWLISDIDGLKEASLIDLSLVTEEDAEVVESPRAWLRDHLLANGCVKSPHVAKRVISALNPSRMRLHSRSFDKFYRESILAYKKWEAYGAE